MKNLTALLTLAAMMGLTGCLSDKEQDTGDSFGNPDTGTENGAPTISGNPPAAIKVGEAYSFTPSASDPDGDSLTFSIQNKPTWAEFDSSTGRVSGIPTLANVGTYSSIRISVSDGQATTNMSSFAIDVTQVATGSISLSWTAPTQNDDGSVLSDLAGYKIYYGKSSRNYSNVIQIDNPSVSTYIVDNLSPDTYYFAATAINSAGIESRYSGEAAKTLN